MTNVQIRVEKKEYETAVHSLNVPKELLSVSEKVRIKRQGVVTQVFQRVFGDEHPEHRSLKRAQKHVLHHSP